MGNLGFAGKTVIKLSPVKSDVPFLNLPKVEKAKYCLNLQVVHLPGTLNPTFSYRSKSPESIVNSFLQFSQVLIRVSFVLIDIHPRGAEDALAQFVSLLHHFGDFMV